MVSPLSYVLKAVIYTYKYGISPMLGPRCRYLPTCSDYALEAIKKYGGVKGGWLAICRICRCQPWDGHGYDPVPTQWMGYKAAMHQADKAASDASPQKEEGPEG
ncbi:MAG: membrane protein insertion efficiency factor YidD [Kordiimonas sp.]|nr:membrane protein insertion efficiency factor YidD [Kordiimonas sp.]|tara:strand:+ start:123 stop:434 length:312 start_codon:yes stop_codon:yes gene_type:complete